MIFNQAKEVVSGSAGSMDEVEVNTFNSKFEAYEGTSITGSNVNALLAAVVSSNISNAAAGEEFKLINVTLSGSTGIAISTDTLGSTTYLKRVTTKAQTGASYTVTMATGKNALINSITITKNVN
ncbi:hypothetical protein D3C72_1825960 [compost metagenome]